MEKITDAEAKMRLLTILTRHVGREKAIDMGELFTRVFERSWRNKHGDSRILRRLIHELRMNGALIGSSRSANGGGYYQARSTSEIADFLDGQKSEAIRKLVLVAAMKKIGLPELMGQMAMSLKAQND